MSYHGSNPEKNKSQNFRNILMGTAIGAVAILGIGAFAVADKVPEGHVGLQKGAISGAHSDALLSQGLSFNPLTTVANLRAQQFPVEVKDLRPKDKDGILFEDMDVTVFVRIKTENAKDVVAFLRTVGDISFNDKGSMLLGNSSIAKEARSPIPQAVNKFSSLQMLDSRKEMEERAKVEVQNAMNAKYPNVFEIIDVNAYGMTYNQAVEASIQAAAAKESQKKVMEIESAQIDQRKGLMMRQFATLKEVSSVTGISVDQILLSQQIANMADTGRYQMRAEPGKLAKPEIVAPASPGR